MAVPPIISRPVGPRGNARCKSPVRQASFFELELNWPTADRGPFGPEYRELIEANTIMSNALLEPQEEQSSAQDLWSVAQGEKNGRPLMIRFRTERPQDVEPTAFPILLSATWTFQPNEHGLPSSDEMERMDKFEDALATAMEASQTAHLMVVLTGDGDRDWLWYTPSEEQAMRQVNKALRGQPRYPARNSSTLSTIER